MENKFCMGGPTESHFKGGWKAKLKVGGAYLSLVARYGRVILKILQANKC